MRLSLAQPLVGESLRAFDLGAFIRGPEAVLSGRVAQVNASPADSVAAADAHAAVLLGHLLSQTGSVTASRAELEPVLGAEGVSRLDSAERELKPSDRQRLAQVIAALSINPASDAAIVEGLYTGRGASIDSVEARLAKRLSLEPINGAAYGSEARSLGRFSMIARSLFAPEGDRLSPETRLLAALERSMDRDSARREPSPLLQKNLAILSDDLYLTPDAARSPDDWLTLARIRARLGRLSVKAQSGSDAQATRGGLLPIMGLSAARLLPGAFGRALSEALSFIEPRDLSLAGFPSVARRWAVSLEARDKLARFHDSLARMNEQFFSLPQPSVWNLALEVTGGDAMEALEMLGAIVGQGKRPLRYIEREVVPIFSQAAGAEDSFVKAARCYYLLGLIHEKSLRRFGRSALYPGEAGHVGPKFWHYYGAAALAARFSGPASLSARLTSFLIAVGYEMVTLPVNVSVGRWRGWLRSGWEAISDGIQDIATQLQGGGLGRRLAAAASEAHTISGARSLFWRARAYAQGLWFLGWWNWGPPVRHVWREYRQALERQRQAGRTPAARDARALFTSLRLLGISGRLAGNTWVAADPIVLAEARALFSRHFEAGPQARAAFERFLDRAALYNPGKRRTKLRAMIAYYMREGSVLPASELAGYYDAQARDDESLKVAHERQERVVADFKSLASELVLEANRGAGGGGRLLGVLIFGSYANGAPRPGSDLDFQVITEDGSAPAYDIVEALRRRWAELPHGVRLEPISFLYVPADKDLLRRLHPEPFIIASPYERVTAALSQEPRRPQAPLAARVTPAGRLLRGLVGLWLRGLFCTVDLYDRLAPVGAGGS